MSMQQSLVVLANSVDFEERKLQLESFKNRLEAITSPALVTAFTNKNIGNFLRLFYSWSLFASMLLIW